MLLGSLFWALGSIISTFIIYYLAFRILLSSHYFWGLCLLYRLGHNLVPLCSVQVLALGFLICSYDSLFETLTSLWQRIFDCVNFKASSASLWCALTLSLLLLPLLWYLIPIPKPGCRLLLTAGYNCLNLAVYQSLETYC